ncbi:hypothetical protein [Fibrivirga algicola]|uniref:Uncharacterized protein n=1 Tax=Fibrivirga algicola TaxID=2950420 RepID=A0ABX0QAU2_9BACT|nr:hypothetical protein [Fibrivirga algicola]NID09399.1 hypothetical protein [Fibrivirga algicola]
MEIGNQAGTRENGYWAFAPYIGAFRLFSIWKSRRDRVKPKHKRHYGFSLLECGRFYRSLIAFEVRRQTIMIVLFGFYKQFKLKS